MREILFRGKKLDSGEWLEGNYIFEDFDRVGINPIGTIINCFVIPATIGQFTGLTDDMGRNLFEGDIVKAIDSYTNECDEDSLGTVIFTDGAFCISWTTGYTEPLCLKADKEDIIIVGNIHDTPELLER